MVKKIRIKFICIASMAVIVIMTLIFMLITAAIFYRSDEQILTTLKFISEHDGEMPFIEDDKPYWHGDEGFHVIFGLAPRIAAASFIAFIAGSFINAYVMSRMKLSSRQNPDAKNYNKSFSARAVLSTVFGEATDSVIFFPLALGGVIPWEEMPSLMISQVMLKTLYEILVLPVTIRVVAFTKKHDHEDVYDEDINYNIFNILKI